MSSSDSDVDEVIPNGNTKNAKKRLSGMYQNDSFFVDIQFLLFINLLNSNYLVEKVYQKKTPLEHVLLRPDTYIGSVEFVTQQMWVYDTEQEKIVSREITYVPGLYKIFDEILVNAADNKQRDKKMDTIKIEINP